MIKIYEVNDVIELYDDVDVPHNLGAETVRLIKKASHNLWVIADIRDIRKGNDKTYLMDEQWFL